MLRQVGSERALPHLAQMLLDEQMTDDARFALQGMESPQVDRVLRESLDRKPETHFHFHGLGYKRGLRDVFVQQNEQPSKSIKPQVHYSVRLLQQDPSVFGFVQKKRRLWKRGPAMSTTRVLLRSHSAIGPRSPCS